MSKQTIKNGPCLYGHAKAEPKSPNEVSPRTDREKLALAVQAMQNLLDEAFNEDPSALAYDKAYKVMEDTLAAIGPLDAEPDKTEAAESVEAGITNLHWLIGQVMETATFENARNSAASKDVGTGPLNGAFKDGWDRCAKWFKNTADGVTLSADSLATNEPNWKDECVRQKAVIAQLEQDLKERLGFIREAGEKRTELQARLNQSVYELDKSRDSHMRKIANLQADLSAASREYNQLFVEKELLVSNALLELEKVKLQLAESETDFKDCLGDYKDAVDQLHAAIERSEKYQNDLKLLKSERSRAKAPKA